MNSFLLCLCLLLSLGANGLAQADEALIRKNLQARLPDMGKIDEVRKSELPGLFEVRVDGVDIYYTDAQANYLMEGNLIDTRSKRNLTEERVDKLTAIKFEALPLKDAFVVVRGKGERKLLQAL